MNLIGVFAQVQFHRYVNEQLHELSGSEHHLCVVVVTTTLFMGCLISISLNIITDPSFRFIPLHSHLHFQSSITAPSPILLPVTDSFSDDLWRNHASISGGRPQSRHRRSPKP